MSYHKILCLRQSYKYNLPELFITWKKPMKKSCSCSWGSNYEKWLWYRHLNIIKNLNDRNKMYVSHAQFQCSAVQLQRKYFGVFRLRSFIVFIRFCFVDLPFKISQILTNNMRLPVEFRVSPSMPFEEGVSGSILVSSIPWRKVFP